MQKNFEICKRDKITQESTMQVTVEIFYISREWPEFE